jgi:transcriptional regulatory protein RtcR
LDVAAGRFREDLYARVNIWSYALPGLAQRPEDIEPNLDHLLARCGAELGRAVRFNVEAKAQYLRFAQSPEALWLGNFRDLAASVTRMATLAQGGRITTEVVQAELQRLRWIWHRSDPQQDNLSSAVDLSRWLDPAALAEIDLFDRLQLQSVLGVCLESKSLSDAGRQLFDRSRTLRSAVNDADRLRKYLARFGLVWQALTKA